MASAWSHGLRNRGHEVNRAEGVDGPFVAGLNQHRRVELLQDRGSGHTGASREGVAVVDGSRDRSGAGLKPDHAVTRPGLLGRSDTISQRMQIVEGSRRALKLGIANRARVERDIELERLTLESHFQRSQDSLVFRADAFALEQRAPFSRELGQRAIDQIEINETRSLM